MKKVFEEETRQVTAHATETYSGIASAGEAVRTEHKQTDRWVKPFFKQYRSLLCLALFLGLLTFAFSAALMFTSGYLIGRAAEMPGNVFMLHIPLIFVRVFGIGKPILQYFERLLSHDWVLRMTSKLRLALYTSLEKDAIFFKQNHRTGDILGLLSEDIGHLQNLYLRTIFPTVVAWLLYALLVVVFGFFSLWFALLMALMLGILVFFLPLVSLLANRARILKRKSIKNKLYRELTDNVLGASDWVFAGRGHEYLANYQSSEKNMREINLSINRFSRNHDLIFQAVFGVAAVLLLLWAGSYFVGNPGGAANWVAAFMLGFFPLIDAFVPLSKAATESVVYRNSITRLNALPDADSEIVAVDSNLKSSEGLFEASFDGASFDSPNIEIASVSFSYSDSKQSIFKDFSLTIKPGEKLAILGRSGSGKSTLASLIRGDIEPLQGNVRINNRDSKSYGDNIANYIGVIQQDSYLFNMSLIENLRIGKADASEEEVLSVLEDVGLSDLVARLPEGLNTMVDEAGKRFSGGEGHRIALARVLLRQVPIIILDEPTVGLDPLTEQALLEVFLKNTKDKTLIMITHHLQGVSAMDRVIFIEEGNITIDGNPKELAWNNQHYQSLLEFDQGIIL